MTGRDVVVGAALVRGARVLAARRSHPASLAGYWELPGGRVEPGESDDDALRRELLEELGCAVVVEHRIAQVELAPGTVLRVYAASLADPAGEPRAVEHGEIRWVPAEGLDGLAWLPADLELLPELRRMLTRAGAAGG
ncbi:(deoxy)nucleoside triphosphate pyrophosphohydrolase [Haloechinothrix aidingensis]|uniref:(deoxy)nucleoside triphosphate pyrophosphohydrolase n=1 Tax=Haloechinothrix aidingensis TaxID=2752311 RepID=UPI0031B64646